MAEKINNIPTVLVIFGATGDLARRKIFPALANLIDRQLITDGFRLVAFGRRNFSDDDLRRFVGEAVASGSFRSQTTVKTLLDRASYHHGFFEDLSAYRALADRLGGLDADVFGRCSNKLFYLAVPPAFYELIATKLSASGLTIPCSDGEGWTRVLIEKPFGSDHKSARKLDRLLGTLFREEQIFRIDHYLAKDTIQNILTFRFANSLFEPLWNGDHIAKVEINLFESGGIGGRGVLYDHLGALRDVGQNHLLGMLAAVAMEKPESFDAASLRPERARVLRKLSAPAAASIGRFVRRGQYEGYRFETGVAADSQTETFFRLKAFVASRRWRGVPFILSSGKALPESRVEIRIHFKGGESIGGRREAVKTRGNTLTFCIQPEERVLLRFFVKKPGLSAETVSEQLSFSYGAGSASAVAAYEKVLFDCFRGDQTLFSSTEEVEASWKFVTPILENWRSLPLISYRPGSEEILRETEFDWTNEFV